MFLYYLLRFLLILLQLNSVFDKFLIFSKCDTSFCEFSFSENRSLMNYCLHCHMVVHANRYDVFVTVLFMAYEARLRILNNLSFGKQVNQILFSSTRYLLLEIFLSLKLVHNPWLFLQSQHFGRRLSSRFLLILLCILVKLTLSLSIISLHCTKNEVFH